ncbi:DUF3800 domain-containing protein [Rhodococcus sp. D2-41]|nr:DUF3800 domain-containing protein [Rhodococcus sp. D2-41]
MAEWKRAEVSRGQQDPSQAGFSVEILDRMRLSAQSPTAEFAYIDESGDVGMSKGTKTFTLGCVLVPVDDWSDRLDYMVRMRRSTKQKYGVPMQQEAKANHIAGVKKIYRDLGLGDGQMRDIYQRHMRAIDRVSSGTFAIVIRKDKLWKRDTDVLDMAWRYLLERLRKRTESTGAPVMIVHDQGQDAEIRKLIRRYRRVAWTASGQRSSAPLFVEDPSPRDSQQSYFVQLADLAAYAASTKACPRNGGTARICNELMWDIIADVQVKSVTKDRNDGLYVFPK